MKNIEKVTVTSITEVAGQTNRNIVGSGRKMALSFSDGGSAIGYRKFDNDHCFEVGAPWVRIYGDYVHTH